MKRIFSIVCLVLVAFVMNAQNNDFEKSWYIQLQGGAAHTVGETQFMNLISPAAAVSVGYQFAPALGARLNLAGFQGKGAIVNNPEDLLYKYNYGQAGVDLLLNIANLFGYKATRVFNPYVFAGIAGNYAFNNGASAYYPDCKGQLENYWEKGSFSPVGRFGVGADFNVSDRVAIGVEVNDNIVNDNFNSKKSSIDVMDWQYNALLGVKIKLGKKKVAPVPVPAPAPAPAPAPEPEPEPEPAPVEVAPAPAPEFEQYVENIWFNLDKYDIRESEVEKINNIVKVMNENPETKLEICSYCDVETGTDAHNWTLSENRSNSVKKAIVEKGISADRISIDFKGSRVRPFENPAAKNRVSICVVDD